MIYLHLWIYRDKDVSIVQECFSPAPNRVNLKSWITPVIEGKMLMQKGWKFLLVILCLSVLREKEIYLQNLLKNILGIIKCSNKEKRGKHLINNTISGIFLTITEGNTLINIKVHKTLSQGKVNCIKLSQHCLKNVKTNHDSFFKTTS